MSVNSMTGFSRYGVESDVGKIVVEIQSVNQKYCDVKINIPRVFSFMEDGIRKKISSVVHRGRLNVSIILDSNAKNSIVNLCPDMDYAGSYINALKSIKDRFGLIGEIDINVFQGNREILVNEQQSLDEKVFAEPIMNALDGALEILLSERKNEADKLVPDMLMRLDSVEKKVDIIRTLSKESLGKYREKLLVRIKEMDIDISVDDERVLKEIAFYADRIDISEELVRLASHIALFRSTIKKGGVIGKSLDFVIQELFRETNTIASKCNNSDVSHVTIAVRTELEKIREQVQNIE